MGLGLLRRHLRILQMRLGDFECRLLLRYRRFDITRIDLEQKIPLLHQLVVLHLHGRNSSRDFWRNAHDMSVNESVVGTFMREVVEENGREINDA